MWKRIFGDIKAVRFLVSGGPKGQTAAEMTAEMSAWDADCRADGLTPRKLLDRPRMKLSIAT